MNIDEFSYNNRIKAFALDSVSMLTLNPYSEILLGPQNFLSYACALMEKHSHSLGKNKLLAAAQINYTGLG